jgi:hypothetical protein
MTTPVLSLYDGPRTTVADLMRAPLTIPVRIIDGLRNTFLMEALLRDAGGNPSSLVKFYTSTPRYAEIGDAQDVREFAEIPATRGLLGAPRVVVATKKGLGVRISKEMIDENDMNALNVQLTQVQNTTRRTWLRAMIAMLQDPTMGIPTIAASIAWTDPTSKPLHDLAAAREVIASAVPSVGSQGDDNLGFEADVFAMNPSLAVPLGDNVQIQAVLRGSPLADQQIQYTGKLPNQTSGLTGLTDRSWPVQKVLVAERKTLGFYSDTRPLTVTPMYGEGNGPNGGPTETWRSDTTRKTAMGLDEPLAACWITGVSA